MTLLQYEYMQIEEKIELHLKWNRTLSQTVDS